MANFAPVGVESIVKNFAQFNRQMNLMGKSIERVGKSGRKASLGIKAMNLALKATKLVVGLVAAAIGAAALAIGGLIVLSSKTAASFETAFVGVLKTTEGLGDGMGELTVAGEEVLQGLRDLTKEVPRTFEELAAIATLGGQFGVEKEGIIDFTKTIVDLDVAIESLSPEQAAIQLTQFANIFGTATEDLAKNVEQSGSAIVELGNNVAASESDILSLAFRLAGTGSVVDQTQAEVLGLAATMAELGINAQAGGSAFSKVLQEIGKESAKGGERFEKFADIAGIGAKEFADLFEKDATEAVVTFIEGLSAADEAGENLFLTLEDIGFSERRTTDTLLRLAGGADLLRENLDDSTKAFDEGTAAAKEAQKFYETLGAQAKITKNSFRDLGFTIGRPFLSLWGNLLSGIQPILDVLSVELEPIMADLSETISGDLFPAIRGLIESFGVDLSKEGIIEGIKNFAQNVVDGIGKVSELIAKIGTFISTAKSDGVSQALQDIGVPEEVSDSIEGLITKVGELATTVGTTLIDAFTGLKAWFTNNWPAIQKFIVGTLDVLTGIFDIIKNIIEGLGGTEGTFNEFFTPADERDFGFGEGGIFEVGFDSTPTQEEFQQSGQLSSESFITGLQSGFKEKTSQFNASGQDAGSAVSDGIKDGIAKGRAGIVAEMIATVNAAINAAEAVLGIESPSKVFAGIGKNVMAGFGKGISVNSDLPTAAMAASAQQLSAPSSIINNAGIGSVDNSKSQEFNFGDIVQRPESTVSMVDNISLVTALT